MLRMGALILAVASVMGTAPLNIRLPEKKESVRMTALQWIGVIT